jgi:membrane protein DedA with SNARE-associated domain
MLEQLSGLIIHIIQSLGYPGIAFLTGTSATAIPIPIEITLPFSGFLAEQGKLLLPFVILAGVIGDLLGSVIGYSIGFLLEENLLLNLIRKFGKFVLISEHEYYQATGWIK